MIRVVGQNMTEGPVTDAMRDADVVIGQEIDRRELERGLPGFEHWFPDQDPHQSISWRRGVFDPEHVGYVRFHRSGEHEGYGFPTPARGMVCARGRLLGEFDGLDTVLAGFWLLNSWWPVHPEHDTAARRRVVERDSLPKINAKLLGWRQAGAAVIAEADGNSLRWDGRLPGVRQVQRDGLDRAWVAGVQARRRYRTEETGKGRDKRHRGVGLVVVP